MYVKREVSAHGVSRREKNTQMRSQMYRSNYLKQWYTGRMTNTQTMSVSYPRTWERGPPRPKGLTEVTELRTLTWGHCPRHSVCALNVTNVSLQGGSRGDLGIEQKMCWGKQEPGVRWEEDTGHGINLETSRSPQRQHSPANTLILDSDLKNSERISVRF